MLIGNDLEELRESLIELRDKLKLLDQQINIDKTKWLTFGNVDEDLELYLGKK